MNSISHRNLIVRFFFSLISAVFVFSVFFAFSGVDKSKNYQACYSLNSGDKKVYDKNFVESATCLDNMQGDMGGRWYASERKYGNVSVFTKFETTKPIKKTIFLLVAFFVFMVIFSRENKLRKLADSVFLGFKEIKIIEIILFSVVLVFLYVKTGIIDLGSLGVVMEGVGKGVNFYYLSFLQGSSGSLPIFPYNPLSYVLISALSEIQSLLSAVGIYSKPYSLLQVVIFVAYAWLCFELMSAFKAGGFFFKSKRMIFYFILLNPLGIYYTVFLGQIDVISIAFFVAGLRRVSSGRSIFYGFILIYFGLIFSKPQHLLLVIPLIFCVACIFEQETRRRCFIGVIVLLASIFLTYFIYRYSDGFYASLSVNPQAARLSWSIWWTMLSDAIVINRPVGMLAIVSMLLVYLLPNNLRMGDDFFNHVCLGVGVMFATFQASFAHTFGLAIFLIPAIMVVIVSAKNLLQIFMFSIFSLGVVIAWGTGLVGDASQTIGLSVFSHGGFVEKTYAHIKYDALLNSIEYSAYIGFALVFLMHLFFAKVRNASLQSKE